MHVYLVLQCRLWATEMETEVIADGCHCCQMDPMDPACLHGTHCRRTYVLSPILDFSENDTLF